MKNPFKGLNEAAKIVHENNTEKGFNAPEETVASKLMHIVSELSEALEAHRLGKKAEMQEYLCVEGRWQTKNRKLSASCFERLVKDTFEDEIADALLRILNLSAEYKIDIEAHLFEKMLYNKTRPYLHGKSIEK